MFGACELVFLGAISHSGAGPQPKERGCVVPTSRSGLAQPPIVEANPRSNPLRLIEDDTAAVRLETCG